MSSQTAVAGTGAPLRLGWSRTIDSDAVLREARDSWLLLQDPATTRHEVIDAGSGKPALAIQGYSAAHLTGNVLLAVKPIGTAAPNGRITDSVVEAWDLSSGKPVWSFRAKEPASPGEIAAGFFYYADAGGIHRVRLPVSEPAERQTRPHILSNGYWAPQPLVAAGRVYFNLDGHEIYGLDAGDLTRGWRAYCDASAMDADADGVYGTGTNNFGFVALRPDGKVAWAPTGGLPALAGEGYSYRQFFRGDFTIAGGHLAIGGQEVVSRGNRDRVEVISPYLYLFDKRTGRLRWKRPMAPAHPVLLKDAVVVWAGHRYRQGEDISPYGDAAYLNLDWRLEAYDPETGRRLWSGPRKRGRTPQLKALGNRLFMLDQGKLAAYEWNG